MFFHFIFNKKEWLSENKSLYSSPVSLIMYQSNFTYHYKHRQYYKNILEDPKSHSYFLCQNNISLYGKGHKQNRLEIKIFGRIVHCILDTGLLNELRLKIVLNYDDH